MYAKKFDHNKLFKIYRTTDICNHVVDVSEIFARRESSVRRRRRDADASENRRLRLSTAECVHQYRFSEGTFSATSCITATGEGTASRPVLEKRWKSGTPRLQYKAVFQHTKTVHIPCIGHCYLGPGVIVLVRFWLSWGNKPDVCGPTLRLVWLVTVRFWSCSLTYRTYLLVRNSNFYTFDVKVRKPKYSITSNTYCQVIRRYLPCWNFFL